MAETSPVLRRISWRDLFPWLILLRSFRIAISPPLLALATLAVLLAPIGWRLAALVFQPEFLALPPLPATAPPEMRRAWEEQTRLQQPVQPTAERSVLAQALPPAMREYLPGAPTAVLEAYYELADPLARLLELRVTLRETAYYAFGFLWTLALWSFPGGVLTRQAILRLGAESPPDVIETVRFVRGRWHWYVLAPLGPLAVLVLIAACIAALGLPIRWLPGLGSVLAGLFWIFVILASLGALWLFGGLLFGFPLMWPTISAERDGDAFEAFSRSYSYVYGKPLHYFLYVVVAALFGALCWAVVAGAGALVEHFAFWALAWGGSPGHVEPIHAAAARLARAWLALPNPGSAGASPSPIQGWAFSLGTGLLGMVLAVLYATVAGFRYAYFFVAASAIYLLLRQDVDEKEMDEVYLQEPARPVVATAPATAASPAAAPEAPAPPSAGAGPYAS